MDITVDATVASTRQTAVSSITLAMTVGTLVNGALVVGSSIRNSGAFATVTGVTWNGTALTLAKRQDGPAASRHVTAELWYLLAPAPGTFNIVVTYSGTTTDAGIGGLSVSGVDQTNPIDATAGAAFLDATPIETTITTVADRAFVVNCMYTSDSAAVSPTQGETAFYNINFVDQAAGAYKGPLTPAGSKTTGWSGALQDTALAVISLKPAPLANPLPLLGVGRAA